MSLVEADEPGPRLTMSGRVVDAVSGTPIPEASVVVYQTDHSGRYLPSDPADESTARIRGDLVTDAAGAFAFDTVLPGEYPDQPPGNRHIHVHELSADGYESTGLVVLFDHNVRDEVRRWAEETGFGRVVELRGDEATGFAGVVELELAPLDG